MRHFIVGIPSYDGRIPVWFAKKLVGIEVVVDSNICIHTSRNNLFLMALDKESNIVMIDDDVEPLFELKDFMKRAQELFDEGYDVLCGLYYLKTMAGLSAGMFKERASLYNLSVSNPFPIVYFPGIPNQELDVDVCGTGIIAVSYDFIKRTEKDYPWFLVNIDKDTRRLVGEDVYFFRKFRPKARASPQFLAKHYISKTLYLSPYGTLEYEAKTDDSTQ